MDLRDHPRFEVNLPVAFWGDRVNGKETVTNLSAGGCAVKGDGGVQIGGSLELNVDLPALYRTFVIEVGVVRWSIGTKFGVDFLQLDSEQEQQLRGFLKTL